MIACAVSRRNSRNGRHAGEHLIAAARAFYRRAIADGLIDAAASPAHRVAEPRRLPGTRRALTAHELEEINAMARTSGNDVILDALLLRLHTETACRRSGALALRLVDLDTTNGLVRLTEKGSTVRWQPITLDLAGHLREHTDARGAVLPTDPLLRAIARLPDGSWLSRIGALTGRVLRARTPDGIDQEIHALLIVYQLLRTASTDATDSQPGLEPDRASFTTALVHRPRPSRARRRNHRRHRRRPGRRHRRGRAGLAHRHRRRRELDRRAHH
ncbi:tyrosine-type recombinase/integrase [Micromonospora sp. NPDC049102]|uniref:tyrosine-type recombinase/integrase n=1 Tax=Micromonospora sp. NPDC049102 TaxID=3364265 RepID=UPI00371B77B7